jgi:hypothetical protein
MKCLLCCLCEKHDLAGGHIICDACDRTYQTTDPQKTNFAPEICPCGQHLLPPVPERFRDVLGLKTDNVVLEEDRQYPQPMAQDWTARAICYLCHSHFAKHHGWQVPVERGCN